MAAPRRGAGAKGRRPAAQPTPQPPPPQQQPQGSYQYQPTAESQINQPYQDLNAAGAYGGLQSALGALPGQYAMGNMYGQLGAGTLGQYGALQQPNMAIQQQLANEIQGIQGGKLDVDPALVQMYGQQQRDLNAQLQRQLGPDAATSSAGIEAQGRFQQGMDTALASANYNRLLGLIGAQQGGMQNLYGQGTGLGTMYGNQMLNNYNQAMGLRQNQLGGASQMLGQTGMIQNLYGNIPSTMGQFGQQMAGMSGGAVNAQGPYQQDRFGNYMAAQQPTAGQAWGQGLQNSGNRWVQAGGNSGQMMGGGGIPQNPYGGGGGAGDGGGF